MTGPRSIPHSREGAAFPLPVLPARLCASHIHSFPLPWYLSSKVTKPIDLGASYPSSLADGGCVRWSKASSDPDSNLTVSFPHIRLVIIHSPHISPPHRTPSVGLLSDRPRVGQLYNTMPSSVPLLPFSPLGPIRIHKHPQLFRIFSFRSKGVLSSLSFLPTSRAPYLSRSGIRGIYTKSIMLHHISSGFRPCHLRYHLPCITYT